MTRQRYSAKESINRILRTFENKTPISDQPDSLTGEVLSSDEALSDLAELFAGSLPNETATLPSAVSVTTTNIPAGTYAAYGHNHAGVYANVFHTHSVTGTATVTDTYNASMTDELIICNKVTAMTVNLPAATGSGHKLAVANINAGQVTVDGNLSETINGETTQLIDQWACMDIIDYVSGKWVIV